MEKATTVGIDGQRVVIFFQKEGNQPRVDLDPASAVQLAEYLIKMAEMLEPKPAPLGMPQAGHLPRRRIDCEITK